MKEALATARELTELYGEALHFKGTNPEKTIKTNQLIVVQDPETDLLGYCSLTGDHTDLRLEVHLGSEGLKSYLDTFTLDLSPEGEPFDKNCLQLTFSRLIGLSSDDFTQIEKLDIPLQHDAELPRFRHYSTGFLPEVLRYGWQCRYFTQILKQLGSIVPDLETISLSNDEILLLTYTPEGDWKQVKVPLVVFLDQLKDIHADYTNDLEAYRINRLPIMNMTFELSQFFIPTPVKKTRLSKGFYPFVTVVFESSSKQIIFAEITDAGKESMDRVVAKFAKTILNDLHFKPKYLISDSATALEHFKGFCEKTAIMTEKVDRLETAREFMGDLLNIKDEEELEAITYSTGFEKEIDVILETARGICHTLLDSPLLNGRLSDSGRRQFISIIELLHVVMMSNFKELPDGWSPQHVEDALQTIFPNLLTEEEMECVPEILYHYIDIVGEAQSLPNYFEIRNRIQELYCIEPQSAVAE